jgi:hypothetical protein
MFSISSPALSIKQTQHTQRGTFAKKHLGGELKEKGLGLQDDRFHDAYSGYWVAMILLALSTSLSMLTFISLALVTLGAALLLVQWKMN